MFSTVRNQKKDDDLTTKGSFDFVHCTKPKKDDDLTTKVTFKFRPLYETKKKDDDLTTKIITT